MTFLLTQALHKLLKYSVFRDPELSQLGHDAYALLCCLIRRAEMEALRADEALAQRMDELEAMEMWANADRAPEWHSWRARSGAVAARQRGQPHFAAPQPAPSRGRRRGWANAASIAEVVMGMFAGAGPLAGKLSAT